MCGCAVARDHDIDLEKRARQRRLLDEQVAEKRAAADAEKQADLQVRLDCHQTAAEQRYITHTTTRLARTRLGVHGCTSCSSPGVFCISAGGMPEVGSGSSATACVCSQNGEAVAKDVAAWQEEEAAKRSKEHAAVMHFKALQDEQVADKEARVRLVRSLLAQHGGCACS